MDMLRCLINCIVIIIIIKLYFTRNGSTKEGIDVISKVMQNCVYFTITRTRIPVPTLVWKTVNAAQHTDPISLSCSSPVDTGKSLVIFIVFRPIFGTKLVRLLRQWWLTLIVTAAAEDSAPADCRSIVSKVFEGQLMNSIQCQSCLKVNVSLVNC